MCKFEVYVHGKVQILGLLGKAIRRILPSLKYNILKN